MKVSDELQIFVDAINARQDDPTSSLFGVKQEDLTEREYKTLSQSVALDQCFECAPSGADCNGPYFTFWREEINPGEFEWHGKRECVAVSMALKNTVNTLSSATDLISKLTPEKLAEHVKSSDQNSILSQLTLGAMQAMDQFIDKDKDPES